MKMLILLWFVMCSFTTKNDYQTEGEKFCKLGNYEKAIEAHNKAISINPNSANAYYNKGVILGELGQYEEAIETYNKAISINPDLTYAYYNKCITLGKLGQHKEAIEAYDKAVTLVRYFVDMMPSNHVVAINPFEAAYKKGIASGILGQYKIGVIAKTHHRLYGS